MEIKIIINTYLKTILDLDLDLKYNTIRNEFYSNFFKKNKNSELKEKITKELIKQKDFKFYFENDFLNLQIKTNFLKKILINFKIGDNKYYSSCLLEHTSANPTGDLTIGNLCNTIYGKYLENFLKLKNVKPISFYYVNDRGKNIAKFLFNIIGSNIIRQRNLKKIHDKISVISIPEILNNTTILQETEIVNNDLNFLVSLFDTPIISKFIRQVCRIWLKSICKTTKKLNLKFNFFQYESKLFRKKSEKEILFFICTILKDLKFEFNLDFEHILEQNNIKLQYSPSNILKFKKISKILPVIKIVTDFGFTIIKKTNGASTYFLNDLILSINKIINNNISIFGTDHKQHGQTLLKIQNSILNNPSLLNKIRFSNFIQKQFFEVTSTYSKIFFAPLLKINNEKVSKRKDNSPISCEDFMTKNNLNNILYNIDGKKEVINFEELNFDFIKIEKRFHDFLKFKNSGSKEIFIEYICLEQLFNQIPNTFLTNFVRISMKLKKENANSFNKILIKKILKIYKKLYY